MIPDIFIKIARVCHEANRSYCIALGDHSQQPWSQAEPWQRDSAIKGVEFIFNHPNGPVSATHDSWSRAKVEDGWVYGEKKDPVAKTHPCLVPFDKLPVEQQAKDYIFGAIARAMLFELA